MKSFKSLQGSVRSLCLDAGAGLVYTSATTDLNCSKLQKYMLHSLYAESFKLSLSVNIEDGIGTAFVPAGKDSAELINATTGVNMAEVLAHFEETAPVSVFEKMTLRDDGSMQRDRGREAGGTSNVEKSLENEQEWLSRLKKFVALAEATTSEGTGARAGALGGSKPGPGSVNSLGATGTAVANGEGSGPASSSGGGTAAATGKKPAGAPSRRSSRVAGGPPNAVGAGGATDFFKNLLDGAAKK